jgi:glutathione synthase
MRIFVAVNRIEEIGRSQTTALLIAALMRRGCEVHLADVDAFSFQGGLDCNWHVVNAVRVALSPPCDSGAVEAFARSRPGPESREMEPGDMILIRTNPGRDQVRSAVHDTFLYFCRSAQATGIRVVNDPTNLRFLASKASLGLVDPAYRPMMIVSHDAERVADFVSQSQVDCVIKPLVGSRGQNVILVRPDQTGLGELIRSTFGERGVVAQHFVHDDHPGDKRVVVVGGQILQLAGHLGGIQRQPPAGDFRGNLHVGGTPLRLTLDDAARQTAEYASQLLMEYGIWLAGVDLIGHKIIEFNVFSTGGLYFAEQDSGLSFSDEIIAQLLK